MQTHTGREVAAIAWPDVEPRRIELIDLAGHGIELVPYQVELESFDELSGAISSGFVPGEVITMDIPDTVTPEEHAELARNPDIDGPRLDISENTKVVYSSDVVITHPAAMVIPVEPTEPTEPLHMTVPAELFAEQALAVPDVVTEPEIAVEVANDPPGMAG